MPFTLTLLCMEPSRPAVVAGVAAALARELPEAAVAVGAFATGELREPAALERARAAIGASDVVVVSHVLIDDEVDAVAGLLDGAGASTQIIVVSSARPLMRRTRLGRFRMGREGADTPTTPRQQPEESRRPGMLRSLLARIRNGRDITPYLKEMMVLAPKLLRLVPGRMQDVRSYLECHLALIECTPANLRGMILMLADRYGTATRGTLRDVYAPPQLGPESGIYHPDAPGLFASRREYMAWSRRRVVDDGRARTDSTSASAASAGCASAGCASAGRAPGSVSAIGASANGLTTGGTVGLLLLRSDILTGETAHYDATIRAIEARGLEVIAAFGGSFDYRTAVERMLLDESGGGIDAIVSLTAFPLVGGHGRCDTAASVEALRRYGVPYLAPIPLLFQTVDAWRASAHGLDPMQTAMHVALPELDGAIEPIVTSGVVDGPSGRVKVPLEERIERLAARLERWIALRRTPTSRKRIAITLFAFPPNRGAIGTAAYLDVFRSLHNTLLRLRAEGYDVEVPSTPEALLRDLIGETDAITQESAELSVAARLDVESYRAITPEVDTIAARWGEPPGVLNTDGRSLLVHGRIYGNVFVGIQPSFGYEGDPMRLLFARNATPHHGFVAYYRWIERVWRADAHLHFGTHGALEFMPGKQTGLDAGCWPDALVGTLPNIYLYSLNNPSEGTIARRRSLATLVSYMTPPLEHAGLYRELATLKSMLAEYAGHAPGDPRRHTLVEILAGMVDSLHLDRDVPLPGSERTAKAPMADASAGTAPSADAAAADKISADDLFIGRLHAHLEEIESRLIPSGLHAVGAPPSRGDLADLLTAIAEYDRPERRVRSLTAMITDGSGSSSDAGSSRRDRSARNGEPVSHDDLQRRAERGDLAALECCRTARAIVREAIEAMLAGDSATGLRTLRTRAPHVDAADARRALDHLAEVAAHACEERELDAVVAALAGGYVEPAIGSDPVRRPEALPSGRNIHGLDPASVPSVAALRNARVVVDAMLSRCVEQTGRHPESIGLVLWGLDNIKTHGEAIAQAFVLLGVEPVANSIGRISQLEVVPIDRLGRARIDVTIQASGIFRDIFGAQIEMLDEAVRLVAALDESDAVNHVRARAARLRAEHGFDEREAATRIFSNEAGAYGTNLDHMVGMSSWRTSDDLVDLFLERKSFAYGKRMTSERSRTLLEALAGSIDVTLQNLDSSEVGITDVDHYFEYIGGLTAVIEKTRGVRPLALVADTTTARAKVRTLEATIRLEARTKLLNPRWIEGMLRHGYQGVEEIRKRLDYTFGFAATCNAVDGWIFDGADAAFVADEEIAARMRAANPDAYAGLVRRLVEAGDRELWKVSRARLEELRALDADVEDELEGVS